VSTFLDLLRNDPDAPATPVEHGEGDLVRYCFRYREQCAMGLVWREGWDEKENEYALLAAWTDESGQEHRASWVICGSWEIGDFFSVGERLDAGLQSQKLHGLRLNEQGVNALIMFVSSLQSPMCGLRFETDRLHEVALDGMPHPFSERVLLPKDAIHALLDLIQCDPIHSDDESLSRAFMRCDARWSPWIEDKSRWQGRARSPLNDALAEWLGSLRAPKALRRVPGAPWMCLLR
jgi:hypothetical protein